MRNRLLISAVIAVVFAGLPSDVAWGQTDISKFPLAKAVPADAFITIIGKPNAERAFLDAYWADVFQALKKSGIADDLWDLVVDLLPEEKVEDVEEAKDRIWEAVAEVDWKALFEKEVVYAARLRPFKTSSAANDASVRINGPINEGILLCRSSEEKAKKNCASLKVILKEVQALMEQHFGEGVTSLVESEENGVAITLFGPSEVPEIGLAVAQWKDVVCISFVGQGMMRDALGLLTGKAKGKALVDTPRFKQAFTDLPPAEDSLVFFDIEGMLSPVRSLLKEVSEGGPEQAKAGEEPTARGERKPASSERAAEETGEDQAALGAFRTLLDDVSIGDYMASVEWTDGYQVHHETVTAIKPGAKSSLLYQAMSGGKPIERFERFIPAEAESFTCTTGINFAKVYRYIVNFVAKNIPGGEEDIAEFQRVQKEEWELDLEKDILALLDGTMISAKVGTDWIIMLRVTDEAKARTQVVDLLERLNEALGEQNALMMTEIEVAGVEGFKQVSHPMLMMMGGMKPPVLGCADGYLVFASSAGMAEKCLQTGRGKHPNITKNKRWREEAVAPKSGAVDAISFTDQTNLATELQTAIGGLSMGLGMAAMFAQEAPPPLRKVLSALPPLLGKLAPVAGELDFYQSSASYSTFDGQRWHTRAVQTYKTSKPKKPAEEEIEAGEVDQAGKPGAAKGIEEQDRSKKPRKPAEPAQPKKTRKPSKPKNEPAGE